MTSSFPLRTLAPLALLLAAPVAYAGGSTSNCLAPPKLNYTVPADMALTRQADANCFAWQQFIALNWAALAGQRGQPNTAAPASAFGRRDDPLPVVWETFKEADQVFLANGKDPGAWNAKPASNVKILGGGLRGHISAEPQLDLSAIGQASPGAPWLTAQNKLLTMYERYVNEDEYNYIRNNKLYDSAVQKTFALSPGISLPDGTAASAAYGTTGAMEIKAAWLELPNKADWPRFKIARAQVTYPGKPPRTVIVGLTGLHIIHKTALGQQFIWATFEHKQNAPDATQVAAGKFSPPYTYFNPDCNPATDHYKCVANADPAADKKNNPYNAPIQVVRTTPIPTRANNDVAGLNEYVWSEVIAPANPDSVFLNYELVNTLWSNQNTTIAPGARVPLVAAQLSPSQSQEPVANTTMETYVQNLTCLTCHVSAPIAKVPLSHRLIKTKIFDPATAGTPETDVNPLASDYSFLFKTATTATKKRAAGKEKK